MELTQRYVNELLASSATCKQVADLLNKEHILLGTYRHNRSSFYRAILQRGDVSIIHLCKEHPKDFVRVHMHYTKFTYQMVSNIRACKKLEVFIH